jgi:hypothetical protein
MTALAAPLPAAEAWAPVHRRRDVFLAVAIMTSVPAIGITAWWWNSPLLLWASLVPALWLGCVQPHLLVSLLMLMTPLFPVVRLSYDAIGAQRVSTKGLFVSADDPLVAAMALVAGWRMLSGHRRPLDMTPGALIGLAALYPAVIAINALRLEPNQVQVSLLYYVKWIEYAALVILIPRLVPRSAAARLIDCHWRSLLLGVALSAAFAAFEIGEALRSGSYTAAALYPRASAFFGSLDPLRYGASEDPVNFGSYMTVVGAVSLAYLQGRRGAGAAGLGVAAAVIGVLLSASRTPIVAGLVAYGKVQKLRAAQVLLALIVSASAAVGASVFMPELWSVTLTRFESTLAGDGAAENSAIDRLRIAANSPVLEIDEYWLTGHGHSAYRFIAEQHLLQFTRGVSRSLYNFWLTVWYDVGLFGIVLWILLFAQLHRALSRTAVQAANPNLRALARGLSGALWGVAAASMFGEIPYNWRVMGVFYNSVGVCFAAAGWAVAGDSHPRDRKL